MEVVAACDKTSFRFALPGLRLLHLAAGRPHSDNLISRAAVFIHLNTIYTEGEQRHGERAIIQRPSSGLRGNLLFFTQTREEAMGICSSAAKPSRTVGIHSSSHCFLAL